ncbi:MAG: hypothetical protein Unbinned1446contig1005_10 [Prokaryotic dsDNA virus sp.]|nr:MAG: hypothetical protein Unbinned1446contig1005_10 [Prokaryotic dsDNA virus sp.]|tara:strand:+ start:1835 stop:2074 length:240 start_codon:yes stop_codon:yes gene_type:complete
MYAYECIITTPRRQPTNESEYMDLIEDMIELGYIDSTMGTHGYTFELIAVRGMNENELKDEVREVVNYYGLTLADMYPI